MFKKKDIEEKSPERDMSMTEKLDKLLEYFEAGLKDKKKKKEFKLPYKARVIGKTYYKRNKIVVLMIQKTGTIKPMVTTMMRGMIKVKDNWHTVPFENVLYWKAKLPVIILPEWAITPVKFTPFDAKIQEDKDEKDKNIVDAQTYIIRAVKMEAALLSAKKLGGKALIWIIIGGIIVAYLMFGGVGG